jgi:putative alpha-1,2-mannosidase
MGPYREGGPWQYRFYVPHDPDELNNWGYDGKMCEYLNDMMTNSYRPKDTNNMIHEEKELYNHMFGQYAHNNQPVHHILYMFHHVGCRQEGEKWIHKVLEESYTDTGYPGDEDNGEMSAWYILSSIGLYSLVPGTLQYQISSSPLWDHVNIDNGRIIIERSKNSKNRAAIINYSNEKKYIIQT